MLRKGGEAGTNVARLIAFAIMAAFAYRTAELLGKSWLFDTDDAFITLRYARHWSEGHGIVWNLGEPPLEGYSNFSVLALATSALRLGYDPLLFIKCVCVVALFASIGLSFWLARTFVGPIAATIPALLLTSHMGELGWAVSGLETLLYQALALGAVACTFKALGFGAYTWDGLALKEPAAPALGWTLAAGLICVLAGLTRPEGPLVAVACSVAFAVRVWTTRGSGNHAQFAHANAVRCLAWFVAVFGALYGAYFAWRFSYFGRLFPNPVYCKAFWNGDPWFLNLKYWAYGKPVVLLALFYPWKRLDARHVLLWLIPIFYAVVLYGADPIVSLNHRHWLTGHAILAIGMTATLGAFAELITSRAPTIREALLLFFMFVQLYPERQKLEKQLADWSSTYDERIKARQRMVEWLKLHVPEDRTIALADVGLLGYLTDYEIKDIGCLNSAQMTSDEIGRDAAKYFDVLLQSAPDMIVVHSYSDVLLRPRTEYLVYPILLKNPEFQAWYDAREVIGSPKDDLYNWMFRRRRERVDPAALEAERLANEAKKAALNKPEPCPTDDPAPSKSSTTLDPDSIPLPLNDSED